MLRVGILSCAHLHCWGYVASMKHRTDAQIVGIWDDDVERGETFAQRAGIAYTGYLDDLLAKVDAVCICSVNAQHAELGIKAAKAGKHILCEKPLVTNVEDGERFLKAVEEAGVVLMTAFPCRFSPAYQELKAKVQAGEIGKIRAICATNRGSCPFGWFIEKEKSGGGAMIDHVVHVTDLLRDLLEEDPIRVQAQTGNNIYHKDWEDTAMVTIEFPSGVFVTLDSSWSRPKTYRTWGDVTMNVVGEAGMIELDMFGTHTHVTTLTDRYSSPSWGSDLDQAMVDEFISACQTNRPALTSGHDGFQAAKVALAGYRSLQAGQPVPV